MIEIITLLSFFVIILLFYKYFSLKAKFEERIKIELNKLREIELQDIKKELKKLISKEYQLKFEEWIKNKEREIREDAIKKSRNVIIGKVSEQFAPFLTFSKYKLNPKDARFLGNPIDYVVFRGLSEGKLKEIVFVEIKKGDSRLTKVEKEIKEILEKKKVDFLEIYM